METFRKREKEIRRAERQRDKAAKRKEIKARKAARITNESDRDTETTENAATSDPRVSPINDGLRRSSIAREGGSRGDPVSRL